MGRFGLALGKRKGTDVPRIFISIGKSWKGVYFHFSHGTLRIFYNAGWRSDYRAKFSRCSGVPR